MAARNIYASIFGETPETQAAYQGRNATFQDMLNQRKQAYEQAKTDNVKMAKYNALGNLITSMVQPIGWAAGGSTAGVQPYDNRAYLESFSRAVKANDDLRNIGSADAEYQFKLADEAFQRAIAREDEERKRRQRVEDDERKYDYQMEKQRERYKLMGDLAQQRIAGQIEVAEANAKAKYQYRVGGRKGSGEDKNSFFAKARKAYTDSVAEYYKMKAEGYDDVPEPMTYNQFLQDYAARTGVTLTDTTSTYTGGGSGTGDNGWGSGLTGASR